MRRILVFLGVLLAIGACKPAKYLQHDRPYPRLAASISFPQKACWGGPAVLSKYEMIYGNSNAVQVAALLDRARREGFGEWADRVIIVHQINIQSPIAIEEAYPYGGPPDWWLRSAQYDPTKAVALAIWRNNRHTCDWYLRDETGNRLSIWTKGRYLTNWSEQCPRGRWDGRLMIGRDTVDIGDTRGLTLVEWICSGLRDKVVRHPIYRAAYGAIQLEDGPLIGARPWVPPNTRVVVSPAAQPISIEEYNTLILPNHERFMREFVLELTAGGPLLKRMIVRCNGHTLGPFHAGKREYELIHETCNAPKLECYLDWGGWPHNIPANWFALWARIEEAYGPYPKNNRTADAVQGWELTTAQCMPSIHWSAERQRQHMRFALGHVLVAGEGNISFSPEEDQTGVRYASGDAGIRSWPDIPEAHFSLGAWSGPPAQEHTEDGLLIYYRHFRDGNRDYSVAVNLWGTEVGGIPARDAVWYKGTYPAAERIDFDASD
jgi:hypothetical protein